MGTIPELKPWAKRPFELILHAETHFKRGEDYDRRLALISFDNSIEVSISTYINLSRELRDNRKYKAEQIERWTKHFYAKISFFIEEVIAKQKLPQRYELEIINWYHQQRNEYYHSPIAGVPSQDTIDEIRKIAIWVYSTLFDYPDVFKKLEQDIAEKDIGTVSIPDSLAVPKQPQFLPDAQEKVLAIQSLIGQWEEDNSADKIAIERVADGF